MRGKPNPKVAINNHKNWYYKFGIDHYSLDIRYDNSNIVESHREKYATGRYYFVSLGKISGKHYNSHKEALEAGIEYYLEYHQKIANELQDVFKQMNKQLGANSDQDTKD